MKLRTLALTIMVAAFSFSSSVRADDKTSIAIIDVQKIMTKSMAARSAQEQMDKKKKEYEDEIKAQEEKLQKTEKELSSQQSVLAKDVFQKKAQEFKQKVVEVQRKVNSRDQQLKTASNKAGATIQSNVVDIIKDMAKEKGFTIVLPASQTLYSDASMDISDEVLKRLDKKLPNLKLEFND